MSIEVRNISKGFGKVPVLKDVSLTVPTGELVALLGPSGSGKTTLLRIIAGLEMADGDGWEVVFHGRDVSDQAVKDRKVGFVFQHYALFRHMSVRENVAFGLRVRPRKLRPTDAEIRRRVDELLLLVQLETFAERYPGQLSGGQRQRVALARALAVEPKVLLLDEPFGALDVRVRKELRRWLRRLHDEIHITGVMVTHDQEEALEVADRVVIMNEGRIEQIGTPSEVYLKPATPFVYEFLGGANRVTVPLRQGHGFVEGFRFPVDGAGGTEARRAIVLLRPQDVRISTDIDSDSLPVTIREARILGPVVRVEVTHPALASNLEAEVQMADYILAGYHPGMACRARILRGKTFESLCLDGVTDES